MRSYLRVIALLACTLPPAAGCSKGESQGASKESSAGGGSTPANPAADRAAIDKLRTEFAQNFSAGDIKRIVATYTEDGVLMQGGQPALVGRAAIQEFASAQFELATIELTLTSAEVVFIGDIWAFDRGTYKSVVRFRSGGDDKADEGNYLVLWNRQPDGSWKIARDIDSSSTPEK